MKTPKPPFAIGEVVHFDYPEQNLCDRPPVYKPRSVLVTKIRYERKRKLDCGRWQIIGICFDSNAQRMFYWDAARESRRETWLTLGLYDPLDDDPEPFYRLGKFVSTKSQREFLRDVIIKYGERAEKGETAYCVGVFPWDDSMPEPDRLRRIAAK